VPHFATALILLVILGSCGSTREDELGEIRDLETLDDPDEITGFEELTDLMTAAPGFEEASTYFESDQVPGFLSQVSALVDSGFGEAETGEVLNLVETIEIDHKESLIFPIEYSGDETELQVEVFIDDVDTPRLAFFAVPDLAREILVLIEEFFANLGY